MYHHAEPFYPTMSECFSELFKTNNPLMRMASFPKVLANQTVSAKAELSFSKTEKFNYKLSFYPCLGQKGIPRTHMKNYPDTSVLIPAKDQGATLTFIFSGYAFKKSLGM